MKTKYSLKEQTKVRKALVKEFKLEERQVSKSWLDHMDVTPDPNDPEHWDFLLYKKDRNCYINLKFFPRITVEPGHTDNYDIGVVNYTGDKDFVISYLHNILDA